MSRYKFKLQPQGAIPPDLSLKLKMYPTETAPEVLPAPVTTCPEPTFTAWGVAVSLGNMSALGIPGVEIVVRDDRPEYTFPYPDGCFWLDINLIGCLRDGDVVDFSIDDGGYGLPDISVSQEGPTYWVLYHNQHTLTTPSVYSGSAITITATVNGAPFGVPIYCVCDPAAYAFNVVSWVTNLFNIDTYESVALDVTTFPELQAELVNTFSFNGYLWGAADVVNWAVTQVAGPPVTLPTIGILACTTWYMQRATGESYAGCSFEVAGTFGSEAFGDPITFSCEV